MDLQCQGARFSTSLYLHHHQLFEWCHLQQVSTYDAFKNSNQQLTNQADSPIQPLSENWLWSWTLSEAMRSSAGLDDRRKRLLFRSWHRGMREMDYVLGTFANSAIAGMTESELEELESLMDVPDPDMYKWLSGTIDVPDHWNISIVRQIRSFHLDN